MIEELTLHIAVAPGGSLPSPGDTIHAFTANTAYTVSIHRVLSQTESLDGIVALTVLAERTLVGNDAPGRAKESRTS